MYSNIDLEIQNFSELLKVGIDGSMFNSKSDSNEVVWTQHIGGTLNFMDSMNLKKYVKMNDGTLCEKYPVKNFCSGLYGP